MTEYPLLMNGFGVRATLDRRLMLPQPRYHHGHWYWNGTNRWNSIAVGCRTIEEFKRYMLTKSVCLAWPKPRCPFGIQGDIFYVRETWAAISYSHYPRVYVAYRASTSLEQPAIIEARDVSSDFPWSKAKSYAGRRYWRPSIHMPKWATRLWLVNEGTGIERVQDITIGDAMDEGIGEMVFAWEGLRNPPHPSDWITAFSRVWDSIYADPRPVRIKGVVDHYVSYPWDDVQRISEHRGKPWFIVGNPFVWKLKYRAREKYEQTV